MAFIPVAVEYIEIHRASSSDAEIAQALRNQGFSEEMLAAAFRAAGERPAAAASAAELPLARRALFGLLVAAGALLLIGSALIFVRDYRQAKGASEDEIPR